MWPLYVVRSLNNSGYSLDASFLPPLTVYFHTLIRRYTNNICLMTAEYKREQPTAAWNYDTAAQWSHNTNRKSKVHLALCPRIFFQATKQAWFVYPNVNINRCFEYYRTLEISGNLKNMTWSWWENCFLVNQNLKARHRVLGISNVIGQMCVGYRVITD